VLGLALVALTGAVLVGAAPVTADANEAPGEPLPARALSIDDHSCALTDSGKVVCWGPGNSGALGRGDTEDVGDTPGEMGGVLVPIDLGTSQPVVSLAVGLDTSCALHGDGSVRCWGGGSWGRLGNGATTNVGDEPKEMGAALEPVDLGGPARSIAVGGNQSCALLTSGDVKCWGYGGDATLGQGNTDDIGDQPGEMGVNLPPVQLGTGRKAVALTAGAFHTCALLDNGSVKCWGDNFYGQLGLGDQDNRGDDPGEMGNSLPPVDLGTGRTAIAVSAGRSHTCALRDDSSLVCWGNGNSGRLGTGNSSPIGDDRDEMGDALVPVDLGTGRTATSISAGRTHTCALLDTGDAACWGDASAGQLGSGSSSDVGDDPGEMGDALVPVDLGTGRTATAVTTGQSHTCAVLDTGAVVCWGAGGRGTLGTGNTSTIGREPGEMGDALVPVDLGGTVAAPAMSVSLTADNDRVLAGRTVEYTATITNTGQWPLRAVALTAGGTGCSAPATTLAVGATTTVTCSTTTRTADTPRLNRSIIVGATALFSTSVAATSNTVTTAVTPRVRRPDAQVRIRGAAFAGNDVYNTSARRQTRSSKVARGKKVVLTVRIQNDGTVPGTMKVRGTRGTRDFRVDYRRGKTAITRKVVAGTYRIENLRPGAHRDITMIVRPTARARKGDRITTRVTVTARDTVTRTDVVAAKVRRR
jgi:alpha-tubulin suppressor-like RCC1 family protein